MSFLETLIRPDLEERPQRAEVARAANLLQVGEFQCLQLAYADWFGHDMPPGHIDSLFAAYMFHDRVPAWARHFARRIIALDTAGELDDRDPAWHRFDVDYHTHVPKGVRRFCAATVMVALCVGGGILVGHLTVEHTSQLLPPYFSDRELQTPARTAPPQPAEPDRGAR